MKQTPNHQPLQTTPEETTPPEKSLTSDSSATETLKTSATPGASSSTAKKHNRSALVLALTTLVFAVATGVLAFLYVQELNRTCDDSCSTASTSQPAADADATQEADDSTDTVALAPFALDSANSLNTENMLYTFSGQNLFGFNSIENDGKTARLEFCDTYVQNYYPDLNYSGCNFYDINFDRPIAAIVDGGFGQATGYEVIFFLMADGTVEYMPVYSALKNNDIRSHGVISGVQDVVMIRGVSSRECAEYDSAGSCVGGPGGVSNIAIRSDGKFYDLFYLLEDKL